MTALLVSLLPVVIPALGSLVVAGLGWLTAKVGAAQAAAGAKSKAETAALRVAQLAVAVASRAWEKLGPTVQAMLADGKVTAEERAQLEGQVRALVADLTDREDLEQLATALGLPVPGLISLIASQVLDRFVQDPTIPVTATPPARVAPAATAAETAELERLRSAGG